MHVRDKVTILGLFRAELQVLGIDQAKDLRGDIWSIGDWYRSYPWLNKVDRLYEIHGLNAFKESLKTEKMHDRYPGNWKEKLASQFLIVDDESLGEYIGGEYKKLNYERIKEYKPLDCTASIMIADAIEEGYREIDLFGIYMIGTSHVRYVSGVVHMIEVARKKGIKVNSNYYDEWKKYLKGNDIPFSDDYIQICRKEEKEAIN